VAVAALSVTLAVLVWTHGPVTTVSAADDSSRVEYARADAPIVHDEARRVLSHSQFAERWSFWGWLGEKIFSALRMPSLGRGVGTFILWVVLIWCGLTLLAILGHLIWTIVVLIRSSPRFARSARELGTGALAGLENLSYSDLCAKMKELASQGRFRLAVAAMMVALLRLLDEASVLDFHKSKTNGDYVREYSPDRTGREDFRQFVRACDGTIYGGAPCEARSYEDMRGMFERMHSHVGQGQ